MYEQKVVIDKLHNMVNMYNATKQADRARKIQYCVWRSESLLGLLKLPSLKIRPKPSHSEMKRP